MSFARSRPWFCGACIALIALFSASPVLAEKGKLKERLTPAVMAVVYPGADKLGLEEGTPPAIAVYKGEKIVAYVFSTLDVIAAPGYSGTPFDVIAGVDLTGRITGAKVVFHQEPIIIDDESRQRDLDTFLAHEAGRALKPEPNAPPPDYVAGATISSRAMHAAVLATARLVLRTRLARPANAAPTLDVDAFSTKTVSQLIAEGSVVKRRVTSGDVAAALAAQGAAGAKLDWPLSKDDADLYIEVLAALATPSAIGGNLLGVAKLEDYKSTLPNGTQSIYVACSGPYDFFGPTFVADRRFDRVRVIQGDKTFTFTEKDYSYASPVGGEQLAGLFALPPDSGFDPLKPWRLELLVNTSGPTPVSAAFALDYKVPDVLINGGAASSAAASMAATPATDAQASAQDPALALSDLDADLPPTVPAWVEAWAEARVNVAILAALLSVLTLIFMFQRQLARFRMAHRVVRNAFLLVVLVWLGWIASVQLSIVNVINYAMAPFRRFDLGFYLAEPLMVIVATYTLLSVLLIGRGVFCGWLCPFGALQELLAQVSRALHVPQWTPSATLEKRLWLGKYIAAIAVLVLVLTGIDAAGASTELEPFKTAITSKFVRGWPFVVYAGALLAIGLFTERAYCRYLCPLGGVLAILDRLHLLNLLKRRPECGSPCRLCERACPVRAIEPTGKIVTAECFQCLDCQVEYFDDKRCPPLVQAAKLRSKTSPAVAVARNG